MAATETKTEVKEVKTEEPSAGEETKKEPESILRKPLPNRIIVAGNKPNGFFLERARRILRIEETLYISGRGPGAISATCAIVERLKREKFAKVESMKTGMDVQPFFTAKGVPRWQPPLASITFTLSRGEFASFISGLEQRQLVSLFEKTDETKDGYLSFQQIGDLGLAKVFQADDTQLGKARDFLLSKKEKKLNAPDFIKLASILMNPLLKKKVFLKMMRDAFGTTADEEEQKEAEEEDKDVEEKADKDKATKA